MSEFERAAEAVVEGEMELLASLLQAHPDLVTARSPKHGATLLHYVGANGPVEEEMQKTPPNAVAIAELLIGHGCQVDATIDGELAATPMVSLITSQFPAEAGVQGDLVQLFLKHGAAIDGLKSDGYPLAAALMFGYPDAIQVLLAGGARSDNLVAAAALGEMGYLGRCFDEAGKLTSDAGPYPDPFGREFTEKELVELAIEHAEQYQQEEATEFLRQRLSTV